MVVFGGEDGRYLDDNSVYIFNLKTYIWEKYTEDKFLKSPHNRCRHTAVVIDGIIYIFGGYYNGKPTNELWKLTIHDNSNTYSWEEVINPPKVKGVHRHYSWICGHNMYVIGGFGSSKMDVLRIFDTTKGFWQEHKIKGERIPPKTGFSAAVYKGSLFIIGGGAVDKADGSPGSYGLAPSVTFQDIYKLEFLDLNNLSWQLLEITGEKPPKNTGSTACVITTHQDTFIVIFGGRDNNSLFNGTFLLRYGPRVSYWKSLFEPDILHMEYLLKHSEAPTNQQFLNEVAKKKLKILKNSYMCLSLKFILKQQLKRKESWIY